jgi:2-keto-4-pentenoate hydratase/2-oxohepta-3-ene-1,7-dioic acid hydratase in catechol pathway
MAYQHRFLNGQACELTLGKIVCVGRNYADHAKELNNPIPSEPMLFIKPATAASELESAFGIPTEFGSVHFETEMSVLIGATLCKADEAMANEAIIGIGVGLDLTLRDLQDGLKAKGHPWEKAKSFDGACPLSVFVTPDQVDDLQDVQIRLVVNGEVKQDGNSAYMLNKVLPLISYISQFFTLEPGDVVMTGTPAGVGPIAQGDSIFVEVSGWLSVHPSVMGK